MGANTLNLYRMECQFQSLRLSRLRAICSTIKSVERSKIKVIIIQLIRVLVLKEAPEVIYTGLTKVIGKPKELEKNLEVPKAFENDYDLTIPID